MLWNFLRNISASGTGSESFDLLQLLTDVPLALSYVKINLCRSFDFLWAMFSKDGWRILQQGAVLFPLKALMASGKLSVSRIRQQWWAKQSSPRCQRAARCRNSWTLDTRVCADMFSRKTSASLSELFCHRLRCTYKKDADMKYKRAVTSLIATKQYQGHSTCPSSRLLCSACLRSSCFEQKSYEGF